MKTLRIVVADDYAVFRAGLTILINAQSDMHVVGEAPTAQDVMARVKTLQPDVVLIDVSMLVRCGARHHAPHPDVSKHQSACLDGV